MVCIRAARTLPVNPPGAPFVLRHDLLWQALQRKIRNAPEFVQEMQKCEVISDIDGVVVRDCVLAHANGKPRQMRETVTSYSKQWIIFRQEDGSVTTNLISNGPDNNDEDLQLTYIFEWHFDVEEGTPEYHETVRVADEIALMAVSKSIETSRRLVQDKTIA